MSNPSLESEKGEAQEGSVDATFQTELFENTSLLRSSVLMVFRDYASILNDMLR